MNTAIRVDALTKVYPRNFRGEPTVAIRNLTFSVAEGEAFGFIGPNGAGKSTTIRILTGLQRPSSGLARVFGIPVDEEASRLRMGYVPENPYLFDYLTPLEILQTGVRLHRIKPADERSHCMTWLARLGLDAVASKPIRSFSKGMTQRVALAQALAIMPRLLILDEPLSGLDPVGRRDVVDILSEFKKNGGTLFFTSHVLHDVERLADRFGLIHQGIMRAERSPADLIGEQEILLVRSRGAAPLEGMVFDAHDIWSIQICQTELWGLLGKLRAHGHELIEVRPGLSLETAFMKAVGEQRLDAYSVQA